VRYCHSLCDSKAPERIKKTGLNEMFNPVFGAEVRTLQKLSLRAFKLCSFFGWLSVAVSGFYAVFRQNTKR